ncbi:MAG: hypothetical protein PHP35_02080, partial [Candidatus Colwellbacteria bacterium]|nr:hypothetical protein [Candidatus Colwellbacteria bacterium]
KYAKRKAKVSNIDGLTMEFKDFWFNVRSSSNEPVLRLNAEAKTKEILKKEVKVIESIIWKISKSQTPISKRNEKGHSGNRHRNKKHDF